MADQTDLTLPLTPAKLGRAVGVIVERAFPSPRQENCIAVGEMERELTALCGEAVQAAYNDAGREQCTATYPAAPEGDRRCVQMADHVKPSPLHFNRAGFAWADDEVLSAVRVDARERLARHLFLTEWPDSRSAQRAWDEKRITRDPYIARASELVAVITGKDTSR